MKTGFFFRNLSLLLVLNLLVKPVWILLIDRQVQNQTGHAAYGHYFSLFNLSVIFSFLADAGITNMMNRKIASQATGIANIGGLLKLKLALSLLYFTVVLSIAFTAGIKDFTLLSLILLVQILTSFLVFFRNILTAR